MFTPGEEKREMDKGQQVNTFSLHIFILFEIFFDKFLQNFFFPEQN